MRLPRLQTETRCYFEQSFTQSVTCSYFCFVLQETLFYVNPISFLFIILSPKNQQKGKLHEEKELTYFLTRPQGSRD